ncbi:O-antigen polymerase [Pseudomonas nicosulfuronedens]
MKKTFKVLNIISPNTYILAILITAILCSIDNPLGGLSAYYGYRGVSYDILAYYITSLIAGSFISKLISHKKIKEPITFNTKYLEFLFIISCLFQIIKFINIGDIPLLGDPMSRYRLTIGGLEDFPSRLLAPLGICFYFEGSRRKNRTILFSISAACFLLNLAMMQRQEIIIQAIGILVLKFSERPITIKKIIFFSSLLATSIIAIVGVGAILRYGKSGLSTQIPMLELPIWILHLELVGAYIFGEHVLAISDKALYGLYTFGDYFSLLRISDSAHGAKLIGQEFTTRDTAQSIGAPYSYYLDFKITGVIIIGVVTGFLLKLLHRKSTQQSPPSIHVIFYIFLILNALWSLRSGVFILNTLTGYIIVALFCATTGGGRNIKTIRMFFIPIYLATLFGSGMAVIFRG